MTYSLFAQPFSCLEATNGINEILAEITSGRDLAPLSPPDLSVPGRFP